MYKLKIKTQVIIYKRINLYLFKFWFPINIGFSRKYLNRFGKKYNVHSQTLSVSKATHGSQSKFLK